MLKVQGNKVFENGAEIRLKGVNCAGLEWDAKDKGIVKHVCDAIDLWNANLIRLPISQDRWFGFGREQQEVQNFIEYRETVDRVIAEAAERKAYVILDLHWSDMGLWSDKSTQHKMPDMNSLAFWREAALRYKSSDNVLFGLYNEPREISWDIWKNGGEIEEKEVKYKAVGMAELIRAVRDAGANNVLVIGGLDWAYTFEGMKQQIGDITDVGFGNGIILDCHIYPWKRLLWDLDVTVEAERHPILIGEFGHYGDEAKPNEGTQCMKCEEWMNRIIDFIEKNQYHFAAWDFHTSAGPCLIKNWDYEPTPYFGAYVKELLAK